MNGIEGTAIATQMNVILFFIPYSNRFQLINFFCVENLVQMKKKWRRTGTQNENAKNEIHGFENA